MDSAPIEEVPTSELQWKRSNDLVTWGLESCSTHPRLAFLSVARVSSLWLHGLMGRLAVWRSGKGWSELSVGTTLDASYWKGPDNHGQRTMVLLDPHPEPTES